MSEQVPHKELQQADANQDDAALRSRRMPAAQGVLLDTVLELTAYGEDITKQDYERYAADLGLEEDYKKWLPGTAVKTFDKQALLDDAQKSRSDYDAEASIASAQQAAHDTRQADYDKMAEELGPETDEQTDRRITNTQNRFRITQYNQELNTKRETERQEKAADYAVEHVENINQKSMTELATLLGEKPNFQISKQDYIARVEARRDQLKADRDATNTISATDTLGISNKEPSKSTQETVQALKAFQKQMLTEPKSEPPVDQATKVELPTPAEAQAQLRAELQTLLDKKQVGELDDAGKKEVFGKFAALLAATKAAARAEGKSDEEIKQAALDVEKEYADAYGLWRKVKLPLPAPAKSSNKPLTPINEGAGRDKWGTPGRGDLAGSKLDLATRPKQPETKEKKKYTIRKKLGAAALGIIAFAGLYGLSRHRNDDPATKQDKTEQTTTTNTPTTTAPEATTTTTLSNDMIPNELRVRPESTAKTNNEVPTVLGEATQTFMAKDGLGPWAWMRSEFGLQGHEDIIKKLYETNKKELSQMEGAYLNEAGDVRFNKGAVTYGQEFKIKLSAQAQQLLKEKLGR